MWKQLLTKALKMDSTVVSEAQVSPKGESGGE